MSLKSTTMIFVTAGLACSGTTLQRLNIEPIEQEVVFQHSHLSDILNSQFKGWIIDNKGYLKAYDITENERNNWRPLEESGPDSGYISSQALLADYQFADRIFYRVPLLELRKYFNMLQEVAKGEISEPIRVGIDEPISRMVGYLWDTKRDKYRAVLISLSGDWLQVNKAAEAEKIENWLAGLDRIYNDSLASWSESDGETR